MTPQHVTEASHDAGTQPQSAITPEAVATAGPPPGVPARAEAVPADPTTDRDRRAAPGEEVHEPDRVERTPSRPHITLPEGVGPLRANARARRMWAATGPDSLLAYPSFEDFVATMRAAAHVALYPPDGRQRVAAVVRASTGIDVTPGQTRGMLQTLAAFREAPPRARPKARPRRKRSRAAPIIHPYLP